MARISRADQWLSLLECCRGTSTSQEADCRPLFRHPALPREATIVLAVECADGHCQAVGAQPEGNRRVVQVNRHVSGQLEHRSVRER